MPRNTASGFILIQTLVIALLVCSINHDTNVAGGAEPRASVDLGPADALSLRNEAGDQIVLRNREKRLSWSDRPSARTYTLGFVQVEKVFKAFTRSEAFVEGSKRIEEETAPKRDSYKEQLGKLAERIRAAGQDTPEGQQLIEEYKKLAKEYEDWNRKEMERRNQQAAALISRSYDEMRAAIDVVAQRLDLDIILQAYDADKGLTSTDTRQALADFTYRAVLRFPGQLDITADVLSELNLKAED